MANGNGGVLERAGIDNGYLNKKGTPVGQEVSASSIRGHIFNQLAPGTDIQDQSVADIDRTTGMTVKKVVGIGYAGDGWDGGKWSE